MVGVLVPDDDALCTIPGTPLFTGYYTVHSAAPREVVKYVVLSDRQPASIKLVRLGTGTGTMRIAGTIPVATDSSAATLVPYLQLRCTELQTHVTTSHNCNTGCMLTKSACC
jgi:hypothetical protein